MSPPNANANDPIAQPASHPVEKNRPGSGKSASRILIVEDSPTQAQQLQFALEAEGFEIEIARDGQQGYVRFEGADFALVISDILMPTMSGYELCRQIKAHPTKGFVPVILLTSLTDPMDIIQGLECGADNFITKPYQRDFLVDRVKTIFASTKQRGSGKVKIEAVVAFMGKKLTISSDKEQMLSLLVSTFEDVVRTNRELRGREMELESAKNQLNQYARHLEGQVRSTEDKYRRLMEQAKDAIFIMDTTGKVQEVNRQAEVLLGRTAADMVGTPFEQFVPAAEADRHREQFQSLLTAGSTCMVTRLLLADGGQVDVENAASLVDIGGERVVLAIVHDMTERTRLERQLQQAQKMEAIGRLAGGVAHDFNNLLTIIGGYSDILLSNIVPIEATRPLIQEIKKAGERASGLTHQLLAFSRQQMLQPIVLDLNTVVSGAETMLVRLIGEDVKLSSTLHPALGLIKADRGQLEQVIMNLVVNARDAMPQGGQLNIETSNVELDGAYGQMRPEVKPGHYVGLVVSDTGCGMDEATKALVFDPFFTTKEPGKGTGLGLATVYGIVKQSGGFVYLYSEPGIGTTVKIYFPLVEEQAHAESPALPIAKAAMGTETVLLVEDEAAVRQLSRHVLEMYGYAVLEAANGDEAIAVGAQHKEAIDLLVSDVVMPGLGVRKMTEQLVQARPAMKVLYLSGYTDDAAIRHGIVEAETAFLQKPFTTVSLAQKVREVLDRS